MLRYADLITDETAADIAARIRSYLAAGGLPVASWAPSPFGLENLRVEAVAAAVQALMAKRLGGIGRGRLLATATDVPVADGGDGPWLSFLGEQDFRVTKRQPTKTIKYVGLFTIADVTYDFEPGDLIVRAPATGNRYISLDGGHFDESRIPPPENFAGNALVLRFEAEDAGSSYDDPIGTVTEMVSARAGVQCVNTRPTAFAPTILLGTSGGAVTAFFAFNFSTGNYDVPSYTAIFVRIDASGNVGAGGWSWKIPGGDWTPAGPLAKTTEIPGSVIFMKNGASSPSFKKGDIFVLNVASDVVTQGGDLETDAQFAQICRFRHLQISDVPVAGALAVLARAGSPEAVRVSVDADSDVPGLSVMTIASSVGPASPDALAAVQAFVGARFKGYQGVGASAVAGSPEERALAVSAQPFPVTPGGTVFCPRDLVDGAKVAANRAWLAYLASIPIGAGANAVVRLAKLVQVITDAGAEDVDGETINGSAGNLAIPLNFVAVAADGTSVGDSMTWVPT